MFSTKAISLRTLSRSSCQLRCPATWRPYATNHDQRTKETLKVSSRLTWLTTTAALGAAALYYSTSSSPASASDSSAPPKFAESKPRDKSFYNRDEAPKPVEDRHGDTVEKHSIAAHRNQTKVREGKFSGKEFDNHVQAHTPGEPGGDFEKKS